MQTSNLKNYLHKTNFHEKNFQFSGQVILLVSFMFMFGMTSLILGQDNNWDLRSYHFYNGYAFVNHIHKDIMGGLMQTYLNPLFDVITYFLIELHNPRVTSFLLGAVDGVNAFLIFKIARKVFSHDSILKLPICSLFAVLMGLTGAGTLSLIGSTTADTYSSVLVLTSLYFYLLSLDEKPARFYLSISGIILGAVLGLKLTNISFFIALNVTLLFFEVKFSDFIIYWLSCFLGFFIVDGFWIYQVYMQFGNPIFPFYNNFFHSPYISHFTFNLSPGMARLSWQTYLFLPFYLALHLNQLTTEVVLRETRFAIIATLFIIFLLKNYRTTLPNNKYFSVLLKFFILSYLIWCCIFHVYRYLLPIEMLSGIVIIYLLKFLFDNQKYFFTALTIVTCFAWVTTHPPHWGRKPYAQDFFVMQAPEVPNDAVIVLLSRPYTYVIPFFNSTAHFIGLNFVGLGARSQETNNLLYQQTVRVLHSALQENKLYSLGFKESDYTTTLSYAILLSQNIGPTPACQPFTTNIGDQLELCKLRSF